MPKCVIDYSNTIFYKIYCLDDNIKDAYIGHTTNFVQRKYAHKNNCMNSKAISYDLKLYKVMRDNKGWDNWKMEIIGFHSCEDLNSAKIIEQQYFIEHNATLNSIQPFPLHKTDTLKNIKIFECNPCNFSCNTAKDYKRHILTMKHKEIHIDISKKPNIYTCNKCDKTYLHSSTYYRHKTKCNYTEPIETTTDNDIRTLVIEMIDQNNIFIEQNKQIIELLENGRKKAENLPQSTFEI